jgi:hypothetical protein
MCCESPYFVYCLDTSSELYTGAHQTPLAVRLSGGAPCTLLNKGPQSVLFSLYPARMNRCRVLTSSHTVVTLNPLLLLLLLLLQQCCCRLHM